MTLAVDYWLFNLVLDPLCLTLNASAINIVCHVLQVGKHVDDLTYKVQDADARHKVVSRRRSTTPADVPGRLPCLSYHTVLLL